MDQLTRRSKVLSLQAVFSLFEIDKLIFNWFLWHGEHSFTKLWPKKIPTPNSNGPFGRLCAQQFKIDLFCLVPFQQHTNFQPILVSY